MFQRIIIREICTFMHFRLSNYILEDITLTISHDVIILWNISSAKFLLSQYLNKSEFKRECIKTKIHKFATLHIMQHITTNVLN